MKKPLIVLTGPTASGKTALSVALARSVGGEIVSADSMQVYKHMNIGTAKITPSEMEGIPHYLIDELEPTEDFDVTVFQQLARKYIDMIHQKGCIPILAGGTGFYIQAVLYGIDFTESEELPDYRKMLFQTAEEQGAETVHQMLHQVDPASAVNIHPHNIKRVVRALEYFKQTGQQISQHNAVQSQNESPYDYVYFVIQDDRQVLYERINSRVDHMIRHGLVEETRKLLDMGCSMDNTSMKAIGYKEIVPYVEGQCSLDEAVEQLKQNTRRFAKRQMTWFRREKGVTYIDLPDFESRAQVIRHMLSILRQKGILLNWKNM